jgi:predicted ATP-grasp superfamily ATP-dependent carboligase
VRKPRFGAGSQDAYLLDNVSARAPGRSALGEMVEQAFVPGIPASVAFVVGRARAISLPPCRQLLSDDGRFTYLGGQAPLAICANPVAAVASQAVANVPELLGFIGVDVVIGHDNQYWVIEINPRLTTSYIGLRELAETNLAEVMLQVADGREPPAIVWRPGTVEFTPDGHTRFV